MIFSINRVGSIEEDIREARMDLDDAEMYLEKLKEFLETGRYRKKNEKRETWTLVLVSNY